MQLSFIYFRKLLFWILVPDLKIIFKNFLQFNFFPVHKRGKFPEKSPNFFSRKKQITMFGIFRSKPCGHTWSVFVRTRPIIPRTTSVGEICSIPDSRLRIVCYL
jgi:hypothetical protein